MAFDTPARIAIIGAGPIGLEAALYARYLGYDVDLYERGYVCESVRRWGHAKLFTPFREISSTLGLAALAAHDPGFPSPSSDELLTGHEWLERYLLPLAQTDLLEPSLREQHEVLAVGHEEMQRSDAPAADARGDYDFQLLIRDTSGRERWESADIVLDASGVYGKALHLGPGGMPAAGELRWRQRIEYGLPDVLGRDRPLYAGRRVLLVGASLAAAQTLLGLEQLAAEAPGTQVVWLTTAPFETGAEDEFPQPSERSPIMRFGNDAFPERERVAEAANQLAAGRPPWLTWLDRTVVQGIEWSSESAQFLVSAASHERVELVVDRVISCIGWRPDYACCSELPLELDGVWEAPAALGRALSASHNVSGLGPAAANASLLLTSEPNFYILGTKSYGRHPGFLFAAGLQQIRALFSIIGERADLDLYATAPQRVD